jgi:hypothetical protein
VREIRQIVRETFRVRIKAPGSLETFDQTRYYFRHHGMVCPALLGAAGFFVDDSSTLPVTRFRECARSRTSKAVIPGERSEVKGTQGPGQFEIAQKN